MGAQVRILPVSNFLNLRPKLCPHIVQFESSMSAGLEMRFFTTISHVRLAEWSKAWDLSSHNRKIAWVRTPHLTKVILHLSIYWRTKQFSQPAGFEPARGNPIGFQVQRLNHSATTALICTVHRSGWQKINNILLENSYNSWSNLPFLIPSTVISQELNQC